MKEVKRTVIPLLPRSSGSALCWRGDALVDWKGIFEYRLDGTSSDARVSVGYRFDRAVTSESGGYVVVYEQLGTKGVVLKKGQIIREINRSFYQAHVYEYPIVFLKLPDGTEAIAHCPDYYNVIEIEEVESGKRLTTRTGQAADFFHSRLQVSPNGKYLMSAGWHWHPWDYIQIYNVEQALENPETLDQIWWLDHLGEGDEEVHTAAFNGSDRIVFSGETEEELMRLGIYDIEANKVLTSYQIDFPLGTLMPLGKWLVSFFEHPKLVDLDTGEIVYRWPDLASGTQNSSIIYHHQHLPTIALDPEHQRFAVVDSEKITVVQLG